MTVTETKVATWDDLRACEPYHRQVIGAIITHQINSDPEEVRKLRVAIAEADAGHCHRRRDPDAG